MYFIRTQILMESNDLMRIVGYCCDAGIVQHFEYAKRKTFIFYHFTNKAKAISAELLELTFKNKLEETGETRWNGKKEKNWKKKNQKQEETEW